MKKIILKTLQRFKSERQRFTEKKKICFNSKDLKVKDNVLLKKKKLL